MLPYPYTFASGRIGSLELPNRLIVPAMTTRLSLADGTISEAAVAYYARKAMGGWGMIITENIRINPAAGTSANLPGLWTDSQIESHRMLTDRVHQAGGRLCAQIYHAGAQAGRAATGEQPTAPSALCLKSYSERPRELTVEAIHLLVKQFAGACRRAVAAGYDAIELHGAHGYLVGRFLSANSNKRTDDYGGTQENRNRFLLEVLFAVRREIGPDFPLLLRLSASEYLEGGISLAETAVTATLAERTGVDAIHCSAGSIETNYRIIPPTAVPQAAYIQNARFLKDCVDIPVIAVGRINTPMAAEMVLRSGYADFVAMGRASLADPDLPQKAQRGEEKTINQCIGCVQGCLGENKRGRHCTCMVNPLTGYETQLALTPAEKRLHIAVVGGGVSGMEAAITAARRGHQVTLFEAARELGGQWIAAGIPPGKGDFTSFLTWQREMLRIFQVEIRTGRPVTKEDLQAIQPDKVLLAIGGKPFVPPVPGMKRAVLAEMVLRGAAPCGKRAVIIGGGLVGAETAAYLSANGKSVAIVEMLPEIAGDGEANSNHYLFKMLRTAGVAQYTNAKVTAVGEAEVSIQWKGTQVDLPADTVILAAGMRVDTALQQEWTEALSPIPVISVGNAAGVKNGFFNIREAYITASEL